MQIFHSLAHYPEPTALAIGNFDGLHLGHKAILETAKATGLTPAVLTFEPHPSRLFRPTDPVARITTMADKFRLLKGAGIAVTFVQHFHNNFSQTTAEDFIRHALQQRYHAKHIIVGEDFVFGHRRQGNIPLLRTAGLEVTALPPVTGSGGNACSSTRIRQAIAGGDIATANALLGRPFAVTGHVRQGQQKGRLIGFPTLNLRIRPELVQPRYGVYAVTANGQKAIANFGVRPTVTDDKAPWLEIHLLENGAIPGYGDRITVGFHDFIRPEMKFANLEALQLQIAQDIHKIPKLL